MAHLDLKADNYAFNERFQPVLIDFGSAAKANTLTRRWSTTMNYVPPEVLPYNGSTYQRSAYANEPVDVFTLALTWFVINHKKFPFDLSTNMTDYT